MYICKKNVYIYIYVKFSSFNQPYCLFYCRSKCPKIFQSFCVTQKLYTIDFSIIVMFILLLLWVTTDNEKCFIH